MEQIATAIWNAPRAVEAARQGLKIVFNVCDQFVLGCGVHMHCFERPHWLENGGVPILGKAMTPRRPDRDKGLALGGCKLAACLQEVLYRTYRSTETHDHQRLVSLRSDGILVGPPAIKVGSADDKDMAFVEKPGRAECRQILYWDELLLLGIGQPDSGHVPVPHGLIQDGPRGRRQHAGAPLYEHVCPHPVEHLAIESVVARDGHRGGAQAGGPQLDAGHDPAKLPGPRSDGAKDGNGGGNGRNVQVGPSGNG